MTTAEIRWFFDEAVSFGTLMQSFSFSEPSERVDYYLLCTGERLGVKWREGSVEAKQQQGKSQSYSNGRVSGEVEFWKKWSFTLDEQASYADDFSTQPQHWLAIRKQRQTAGFAYDPVQQTASPVLSEAQVSDGCSLEITYVTVAGKTYATLGLEAFGRKEFLQQNLISSIDYLSENGNLDGLDLLLRRSSNYARWIHANFCHTTL